MAATRWRCSSSTCARFPARASFRPVASPTTTVRSHFYRGLGFEQTGDVYAGELVLRLTL